MNRVFLYIIIFFSISFNVSAQEEARIVHDVLHKDTIKYRYLTSRLDSSFIQKNRLARFFTSTLTKGISDNIKDNNVQKENKYNQYEGRIIDSIIIIRGYPFTEGGKHKFISGVRKFANNTHVLTKEKQIRNNIIFSVGEEVDPLVFNKNEFILRDLDYLSDVDIEIEPVGADSATVYVYARDKFSIGIGADYSSKRDSYGAIYESNFLGLGNRFEIKSWFNKNEKDYFKGMGIRHYIPNIGRSFVSMDAEAIYGEDIYRFYVNASKEFIHTNDWAAGAVVDFRRYNEQQMLTDTFMNISGNHISVWGGKSISLNKRVSFFAAAKYENFQYKHRPEVMFDLNPYYHNHDAFLGSIGIYRERFYKANMVYGFGRVESIPYGYNFSVTGGYVLGEYENSPYLGLSLKGAHKTTLGYFSAGLSMGSRFTFKQPLSRAIVDVNVFYFSNMLRIKNDVLMRLFIRVGYSNGFNMMYGERERINFSGVNSIRNGRINDQYGTTRLYFSPEIVLFTPLRLWGFRFAFFTFSDMGFLGYDNRKVFSNDFYGTMGIGVRIKNENLIFNAVQLRFGFLLNKTDNFLPNHFSLDSDKKLYIERLNASEPDFIEYR